MTFAQRRIELLFIAVFAAWVVALFMPGTGAGELFLLVLALFFGFWCLIRVIRRSLPGLLWRLRNRLIVSYLLIALVPVLLLSVLVGICAHIVFGQIAAYVVTAKLERTTTELQASLSGPNLSALEARFPGIRISTDGSGGAPSVGRGLVLIDGLLHCWAHMRDGERQVTAYFPLTREFLGSLAPALGEMMIFPRVEGGVRRSIHPRSLRPQGTDNRRPPRAGWYDVGIDWFVPIGVDRWDGGKRRDDDYYLYIGTRPTAVLRAVFPTYSFQGSELILFGLFTAATLFLIAQLVALFVGVNITRDITAAVHDLYDGTLRVRAGSFSHRIPIHGRDQVADLASSFNQMTADVERLLQVEKDRQKIQTDLEIAREVQNQLYPRTVPESQTLRITAARAPARVVSGDYYDFQRLENGDLAIAIADVAGKGISAALLMATIQSSFRMELRGCLDAAGNRASRPSDVIAHLNRHLWEFTSPEKYATFFFGLYDERNSTLTYTNAGHLQPILVRDGQALRLDVNGMVVGAFPFAQYEESSIVLQPGDIMLLFTDGITEPENEYEEMFGEEQLAELLVRNEDKDDESLVKLILDSVKEWTGSEELQDDMTLLMVRRR